MSWSIVLSLGIGAYAFKALGVFLGSGRKAANGSPGDASDPTTSNTALRAFTELLPPAVLFGLIASQTMTTGTALVVDARLAGVTAGAIAAILKAPFWAVLLVAAATTAATRAMF